MAQQIRFLLVYLEVPFEDETYEQGPAPNHSCENWENNKDFLGLEFPSLPYLIDDSTEEDVVRLTETRAILKYISAKY